MKISIKFLGLCLLIMSTYLHAKAQEIPADDSSVLKKRIYKVSIITADSKRSAGYLASLSDSNLYLSPHPLRFSLNKINDNLSSYPYDHLEKIEIKRKGAAGRGAWRVALIGCAAGAIIGFASGDDPVNQFLSFTAGDKAILGGFVGAFTGSLIGALIGSVVKKKFIIERNKQKFNVMRQNILEKLYVH
jgi:hypothetical protein